MSAKTIAVLGAGLVGKVIIEDLLTDEAVRVVAADRSETALAGLGLNARLATSVCDLSAPDEIRRLAKGCDVLVGAVPGFLGHRVLQAAIETGRPIVDISFSPEDPAPLDVAARRRGVPVVIDCGVAPGLSNLLVGCETAALERVDAVRILVGGLPVTPSGPFAYRFVFSPTDVIEEYLRPSRFRIDGREVTRPALSDIEQVSFSVGTLEAFNTDGLRTLLDTIPAPNMVEKTLRYPGHADAMRLLRETGLFDSTPLSIGETTVSPRAMTEKLLGELLRLQPGEEEFTLLQVTVEGEAAGDRRRTVWEVLDRTDSAGRTSMSRTTGFPCAIVARLLANRRWTQPGVHPPEILGRDAALTAEILEGLRQRGVGLERQVSRPRKDPERNAG